MVNKLGQDISQENETKYCTTFVFSLKIILTTTTTTTTAVCRVKIQKYN